MGYVALIIWFVGFCYFWPKTVYASRRTVLQESFGIATEVEMAPLTWRHVWAGFLVSVIWFIPFTLGILSMIFGRRRPYP